MCIARCMVLVRAKRTAFVHEEIRDARGWWPFVVVVMVGHQRERNAARQMVFLSCYAQEQNSHRCKWEKLKPASWGWTKTCLPCNSVRICCK